MSGWTSRTSLLHHPMCRNNRRLHTGDDLDYPGYDDPHVEMPVDDEDMPPPNSAPEPDLDDDPIELGSGGNPPPRPPGGGTHRAGTWW